MDWILQRVVALVPMILSLTVHEWAHAWSAAKLGDDTAKRMGRLTLDPLAHIDPFGTLILPLLGVPFGWAKPVPVNPVRFRVDMRLGMMITASAGPLANVAIALGLAGVLAIGRAVDPSLLEAGGLRGLLERATVLNVMLAAFNLLPIPPLDGSRVADWLMPASLRPAWNQVQAVGGMFLIGAVVIVPQLLGFDMFYYPGQVARLLLGR